MSISAGIRSIAVYFPEHIRRNEYFRERQGQVIAALEEKTAKQVWEASRGEAKSLFAAEMMPYLNDVFRGAVERRVMAKGETALAMETRVAKRALRAAGLGPDDIDMVLLTSFFPDQVFVGNGVWFARDMEMTCPVWNVESACGSAAANLLLATSLVESGRAKNVLVVVSCAYSRAFDESNPMAWTAGDGASAFVVSQVADGYGVLGAKEVNTKETCTSFDWEVKPHAEVKQTITFSATRVAGRALEETSERLVPFLCHGAADDAGVSLKDVQFFAVPTPTAWFASFAQKKLGLAPHQTIDTFRRFTNTGPVLTPANLYFAAKDGLIEKGDNVMFLTIGSVSTAGAILMKWGDVAVAPESDE